MLHFVPLFPLVSMTADIRIVCYTAYTKPSLIYWPIASLPVCKNVLKIHHKTSSHILMFNRNKKLFSTFCSVGLCVGVTDGDFGPLFLYNPISLLFFFSRRINLVMCLSVGVFFFCCALIKHLVDTLFKSQVLVIHSRGRVSSHLQTVCQFPRGSMLELEKKRMILISVLIPHGPKTDK